MKAPVFAYGTMDALVAAIEKGKIKYPAYIWLKDTLQYAFINKQSEIELVGLPKLTGTLDKQIILSDLAGGVYEIKGQYQVVEGASTVFLSAYYIIAIIRHNGNETRVRLITADNIYDFVVVSGEITSTDQTVTTNYLENHDYVTKTQVENMLAAMAITLEQELKNYVDDIISEQIAELLPQELDKVLQPVDEDDVRSLFG